jgi:hemerythrin-like metal-binding protein
VTYFEWSSAIEIGHTEIDAQHKRLLLLGEAVVEPLMNSTEHKPAAAQLQALIDFAQEHFAFEEGLMRSAGYPEAERHAEYHASLLEEFRTYRDKVQRGQKTNPVGLMSFLWSWLNLHIDSADRELVLWLKSHDRNGGRSRNG